MDNFPSGYYITAELRTKPNVQIAVAKQALSALCAATLQEPGCTLFQLHQDATEPGRFLLWERFDDETAFKHHFEQPHTKEYLGLDLTEVVQFFQTQIVAVEPLG